MLFRSVSQSRYSNVQTMISSYGANAYQQGIYLQTSDGNDQIAADVEYVKFSDGKVLSVAASITANQAVFVTSGTANAESIAGTDVIDMLDGLAGNDTLLGMGGNDLISGGDGNDLLDGGGGANSLSGGNGDDVLVVYSMDDSIDGGAGTDTFKLASDYSGPTDFSMTAMAAAGKVGLENFSASCIVTGKQIGRAHV